ncbi:MAG TPA: hypothetical protein VML75_19925, partial [Kofleriaceae bacterium]|nr:hypothetical protein [Kofleriaceae bacterium]
MNFERSLIVKNQLCRQLAIGLSIASLGLVGTACKRDQATTDQYQQTQAPPQDETVAGTDERMRSPDDPRMGATEPGEMGQPGEMDQPGDMERQPGDMERQQGDMAQQPGDQPAGQQALVDPQVVQGLKDLHASHQAEIKMGEIAQDK